MAKLAFMPFLVLAVVLVACAADLETVEETPAVEEVATTEPPTKTPTTPTETPIPLTDTPVPPTPTFTPSPTAVLIVIRSYSSNDMSLMTDNELGVMIDLLEDAGYEIRIASHTYDPYESDTRTITPDMLVNDVDTADFDAVVMPCLAAGSEPASQEITELVKEFHEQEKVIAAQYGARYTLIAEDLIDEDQLTSREVLQKGSVITSGCCPNAAKYYGCEDGTKELIEKLMLTLNEEE